MTFRVAATIFGLLLGGCNDSTAPIAADTLAVAPVVASSGESVVASSVAFTLRIAEPATDLLMNGVALFGQALLENGDKGRTLVATAATEAGFTRFVSFLTNGTNDLVGYSVVISLGGGSETSMAESSFFSGRLGGAVDFAGYTITSLEFHVDSILLATPGSNPNRDGVWTDSYLRGNLVVFGHPN